jgi:hypothetical protein
MNLFGIGKVVDNVGKIADDLITTDEERLKISLQEREIDASLVKGQLAINEAEAKHSSVFVAGWRPFIGWIGGLALAYQFLLYPLLVWVVAFMEASGAFPCEPNALKCGFTAPPVFEAEILFTIITGMLGIGGMRSYDKMKKTDTKLVGKQAR